MPERTGRERGRSSGRSGLVGIAREGLGCSCHQFSARREQCTPVQLQPACAAFCIVCRPGSGIKLRRELHQQRCLSFLMASASAAESAVAAPSSNRLTDCPLAWAFFGSPLFDPTLCGLIFECLDKPLIYPPPPLSRQAPSRVPTGRQTDSAPSSFRKRLREEEDSRTGPCRILCCMCEYHIFSGGIWMR
jgi:hypothetical protein